MAKILRLGWILVREGVISKEQMEQALDVQKRKFPDQSLGEVVSRLFTIPEEEIETIFINHILFHVVTDWFYREIGQKMGKTSQEIEAIIPHITLTLNGYTRLATRKTTFARKGKHFHPTSSRTALSQILAEFDRIEFVSTLGDPLVFSGVQIEYDVQTQHLKIGDQSIGLQVKVRLTQMMKGSQKAAEAAG